MMDQIWPIYASLLGYRLVAANHFKGGAKRQQPASATLLSQEVCSGHSHTLNLSH